MPKRTDLKKILLIGSGPIVIGQACEFDYSGSQACKALREEGYAVVLINSNPATIMTDPEMADRTYIEPLTPEVVAKVIEREQPDALLPTLGGQTGLNLAVALHKQGILAKYGVELIGVDFATIERAEDREQFKQTMDAIGMAMCASEHVSSVAAALAFAEKVGYPVIIRPSYTLGGSGGGVAYNREELAEIVANGLESSLIGEVLVEESVLGWKEIEFELMRDHADNVIVVCSIENLDPMGIHTGDSITVAPVQTLNEEEYRQLRTAAIAIMRAVGVKSGGANIQFAVNPANGRTVVIEMNPRVSRSSALASKATGFPIAKLAAKLAVGYTLAELPNDITPQIRACFEPALDYCVVKFPRWDFAKFPGADPTLTTQMKAVGEVMAIGRTFKEALQKALRSLEEGRSGLGADGHDPLGLGIAAYQALTPQKRAEYLQSVKTKLRIPEPDRLFYLRSALLLGMPVAEINQLTGIDPWFINEIQALVVFETELAKTLATKPLAQLPPALLWEAKRLGFSDRQLAFLGGTDELTVRQVRLSHGIQPVFKLVDTCAAEFAAQTPYFYSTYETEDESRVSDRPKAMILGSGPNRIGQGIEFDYCCVQAAFALRTAGFEVLMVNCNPETVSTDYDTSDKLYFEPLTLEDVLNIYDREKPQGVVLQFGGQTPLKLALALEAQGLPIWGTKPSDIDLAEDREKCAAVFEELKLKQAPGGTGRSVVEAKAIAARIGYPVLVRPSYVLGGRAMEVVYDENALSDYMERAVEVSLEHPVLIDKFLEDATEVDVDVLADGETAIVGGVMEHIEEAGIHSGDSACSLPPFHLDAAIIEEIKRQARLLAKAFHVVGLLNIQFAVRGEEIYILEVNPRASRTVPFVSKATGMPLVKLAIAVMQGQKLADLGIQEVTPQHMAVKEVVFPFVKFPGVDIILGPEMRSTGEVMGLDQDFGMAFAKAQLAVGGGLPLSGTVLLTVTDKDKAALVPVAQGFVDLGFQLMATSGTAAFLAERGFTVQAVAKLGEGRPDIIDRLKNHEIALIVNTPLGRGPKYDEYQLRRQAISHNIPIMTTIQGAQAALAGIRALRQRELGVKTLQEYHRM